MTDLPTIAVDVMGADKGVAELLAAIPLFFAARPNPLRLILVGRGSEILPELRRIGFDRDQRVELHSAESVVEMSDKPKEAYKSKKDSSMLQALSLVASGRAGAAVSCGNTGTLQFASTLMLRKAPGLERPALATMMPSRDHHWLLIDAGAEPNTSARQLALNAVLGEGYYASVTGMERPRVGLLTIGTEEGKGTDRIVETHRLLKSLGSRLNYTGLIEGFDTFNRGAEVVVTDGFTGNIVLKTLQSFIRTYNGTLRESLKERWWRKLGALLAKGAFNRLKQEFNPSVYGGAPLLGLNGLVIKAHGSSDRHYLTGALRIAHDSLTHRLPKALAERVADAAEHLRVVDAGISAPFDSARSAPLPVNAVGA